MKMLRIASLAALGFAAQAGLSSAMADPLPVFASARTPTATSPTLYSWMSPEIGDAWKAGYKGQGVTMTFVDDFRSSSRFRGNLGTGSLLLRHGEWTRLEGSMIAPSAGIVSQDFNSGATVALARGLNVVNLSYGMFAPAGYTASEIGWSAQESSIIRYAAGYAVISKAAGNDGVNIGATNTAGNVDYLSLALVGKSSAIFVGALNANGTTTNPTSLASYSNKPGADVTIQNNFITVGVAGNKTGLYGTSFAAPIVTGYAAVLGSKFTSATPTQITNQLLTTARQDTLMNYSAAVYGRGEASITRALAPKSIQ